VLEIALRDRFGTQVLNRIPALRYRLFHLTNNAIEGLNCLGGSASFGSCSQERAIIEAALRESGGQVYGPDGAASQLGMPRSTLESKIRSPKINKNRFKPAYLSTTGN
jgi:hypothetical protein